MISVQDLVKRYKKADRNAVDGITFDVQAGEFFALLGPNGAGKTTTISILTTTLAPTSGSARIDGRDIVKESSAVRRIVGIIFQRPSLDMNLTAEENVRFHAILYKLYPYAPTYALMPAEYRKQVTALADLLGIGGDMGKPMKTFSGGMRRKLEIVRSLIHRPKVLFLDEPTGGVDPISRRSFWNLIDKMAEEGVTIIVTTHYLDEAEHCRRIALMHAGRLISMGTVSQLKQVFAGRAVIEVSCPRLFEALDLFERDEDVLEASLFGSRLHLVVPDAGTGQRRALELLQRSGNVPARVEPIVPSLEDVFIHTIETEEASRTRREQKPTEKAGSRALRGGTMP